MNPCHVCSTLPKTQFIIACDNCQRQYCLKCVKIQIQNQVKETSLINAKFEEIKSNKQNKKWLCFSCTKNCLCKQCLGIGISNIQKQLLGKKQKSVSKRNFQQFEQNFSKVQVMRNMNVSQLSDFQKEYFMNKALLYCKQRFNSQSLVKSSVQIIRDKIKLDDKKNIITIDSDQNPEGEFQADIQEEKQENQNIQEEKQIIEVEKSEIIQQERIQEIQQNLDAPNLIQNVQIIIEEKSVGCQNLQQVSISEQKNQQQNNNSNQQNNLNQTDPSIQTQIKP